MSNKLRDNHYAQDLPEEILVMLDKFDEVDPEHTTMRRTIIRQEFRDLAKTLLQNVPHNNPGLHNSLQGALASRSAALLGIPNPKASNEPHPESSPSAG